MSCQETNHGPWPEIELVASCRRGLQVHDDEEAAVTSSSFQAWAPCCKRRDRLCLT